MGKDLKTFEEKKLTLELWGLKVSYIKMTWDQSHEKQNISTVNFFIAFIKNSLIRVKCEIYLNYGQ